MALLTAKPLFYCANVSEEDILTGNKYVDDLKEYAKNQGSDVVMISGKIEEELGQMEPEDTIEFLNELGLKEPGLNTIIKKGYELLGLQT